MRQLDPIEGVVHLELRALLRRGANPVERSRAHRVKLVGDLVARDREEQLPLASALDGDPHALVLANGVPVRDREYPFCARIDDERWRLDDDLILQQPRSLCRRSRTTGRA